MTMPEERNRALLWAGGFLELARGDRLPVDVRRSAFAIARHFQTIEQISAMAILRHPSGFGPELAPPEETPSWIEGCRHGHLRYSTRLALPEED